MNPPLPPHPAPEQLQAFSLGRLPEKDILAVHAHLEKCPTCMAKVSGVREDTFLQKLREGGQSTPSLATQNSTSPMSTQASTGTQRPTSPTETAPWQTPTPGSVPGAPSIP